MNWPKLAKHCKYLKLSQVTLIGHSWGGTSSMEYTARYPRQVKRLLLLDPGGTTSKFLAYYGYNLVMRLHDEDMPLVVHRRNSTAFVHNFNFK